MAAYIMQRVTQVRRHWRLALSLTLGLLLSACVGSAGSSVADKRLAVQDMRTAVLNELYAKKPDVRQQLARAPGYAVFSSANVNIVLASFGGGYGILHNNMNGSDTYLRMGELGLGVGAGVKDFRIVMVFHSDAAMQRFQEYGVAVGAQADAAAVASELGAAVGGELQLDNVTIYQLTRTGLALQATIKGTKYWRDPELN